MPKKNRNRPTPVLPIAFMVSGLILVIAAFVFALNQPSATPAPTAAVESIPYSSIPRVSLADAKAAYDIGSAVFVDVRGEPYYSNGHVVGALSITEADLATAVNQLDRQAWIITYCT